MPSPMDGYTVFFRALSDDGFRPYDYQVRVAQALWNRANLVLRAPTGAGKTRAVLAPFLRSPESIGAARLIYALPLRSLAQGIYRECHQLSARLGNRFRVTMQTGEQPDDPFFTLGDIIVTTYDQVLSGLLCGPYGLPGKLRNINGAIAAGNIVIFDEFHLMQTGLAFLTAVACLEMFGTATRSVWMTATATSPLTGILKRVLVAEEVALSKDELATLPSVARVSRTICKEPAQLSAEAVLANPDARSVIIVNRVSRAQELARAIRALAQTRGLAVPVQVLHARFFTPDRKAKQVDLEAGFGPGSRAPAVVVTTQVVEAGINISCDHLHTEICPMNSLVQRAGRCARFPGESGTVHVYDVDRNNALPYRLDELETAWKLLPDNPVQLDPATAAKWVEEAHCAADERILRQTTPSRRRNECEHRIWDNITGNSTGGVADLIREQSDSIRVAVCDDPRGRTPGQMEGIPVRRYSLGRVLALGPVWFFDAECDWALSTEHSALHRSYAAAVPCAWASYTTEFGLELGAPGDYCSPEREIPKRPGYHGLKRESWVHHTSCVMAEARRRIAQEYLPGGFLSERFGESLAELIDWSTLLHDLGKLQGQWQQWAEAAQQARDHSYCHKELLAHTDFDSTSVGDRTLARTIRPPRPHHAAAGAYYGYRILEHAAPSLPLAVKAACMAAVLGHHGGWAENTILSLDARWQSTLRLIRPEAAHPNLTAPPMPVASRLLEIDLPAFCRLNFATWWPLAAYLTRTLRLSDQLATEEMNEDR